MQWGLEGGLRFRYEFFITIIIIITLLTPSGHFSCYACARRVFGYLAVGGEVWERGKWAVYEEGGDRAIMGGGGSEFSLLCLLFF